MFKNSIWEEQAYPKEFPKLQENIKCDLLIIGAGITGLQTAYECLDSFVNIVIVEQNRVYQGTTASTTAKITYQHGYIYHDLIKTHGIENAQKYYRFNREGIDHLEQVIRENYIDCDFQRVNSYLYAANESENETIRKEAEAYETLGIPGEITDIDSRISPYLALKTENQANFNIAKYCKALTDILVSHHVAIYEGTRVTETYGVNRAIAKTADGFFIEAKEMILANHYPIYRGFNFYFMKMIPQVSYSIVTKPTDIEIENANYMNTASPYINLRYILDNSGKRRLNISGCTHDAKEFKQVLGQICTLKNFGETHFGIGQDDYDYTWCTQDYSTTDYVPLVGKIKEHFYMATSYNEWGMAASVAASVLLKDLLTGKDSDYREFFNPCRVKFNHKLFSYNLKMVSTLLKTRHIPRSNALVGPAGTGRVLKLGNRRVGIYKDENLKIICVDVTCPHMHCGLRWNQLEKTYDCKCHGSRFSYEGKLLDGPSRRDLYRLDIEDLRKYVRDETEASGE